MITIHSNRATKCDIWGRHVLHKMKSYRGCPRYLFRQEKCRKTKANVYTTNISHVTRKRWYSRNL